MNAFIERFRLFMWEGMQANFHSSQQDSDNMRSLALVSSQLDPVELGAQPVQVHIIEGTESAIPIICLTQEC